MSVSQVSWLSSAYTLIYAVGTVTYGKLADRFQLRNLVTFGLLLFGAGSLVGLAAPTFWLALLGRCLQAAGAAAIPALALIIPVRYFAPDRRGSALSMTAVGLALGGALAPVISALVASFADWRWLFLPSLLMLPLIPLYRKHLKPETALAPKPFDWLGGGLLAVSVALLLIGLTNQSWWLLAAGGVGVIGLAARVTVAREPFIQPRLFANQRYTLALSIAIAISGAATSLYFLTPILLSEVHHLSSSWIGFAMVPAAVASSILGRRGGKLADRKGNTYLLGVASCFTIACFALLSTFTGSSPLWIAVFLLLGNVGQSFFQIGMSGVISRILPQEHVGVGMGLFSMFNFIAQGAAVAIYSVVVSNPSAAGWNPLQSDPDSYLFSNIFLVLVVLHAAVAFGYRLLFRQGASDVSIAITQQHAAK